MNCVKGSIVLFCAGVLLFVPIVLLAGEPPLPAVDAAWLAKKLPQAIAGYERSAVQVVQYDTPSFTEVSTRFVGKEGSINVYLGDLSKEPSLLKDFVRARGLVQTSMLAVSNVSIVAMQTLDEPQRISIQAKPAPAKLPPSGPDLRVSEHLRVDLSQSSGRGIYQMALPSKALLLHIPQLSAEKIVPTGELITVSAASVDMTLGERKLHLEPVQALQLTAMKTEEKSFIEPYKCREHDISGWQLYDANMKTGVLILVVADRFALLIEGNGIASLAILEKIRGQVGISELEAAASAKTSGK